MSLSADAVKHALAAGLLSFPATPFGSDGEFNRKAYGDIVERAIAHKAAALFPACGAGEFFSLSREEYEALVRLTVEISAGRLPVLAGVGYGAKLALDFAKLAEDAGADGLLIFPPYLVTPGQAGLLQHLDQICGSTQLATVVYNRDNGVLDPANIARLAERHPSFIAFKDGYGSIEAATTVTALLGDRLAYIGGMPTAEIFAMPYKAAGYSTYSSAIFNFIPEFAQRFFSAVRDDDVVFVKKAIAEFFVPYVAIRSRQSGYAVSIIKAGLTLMGHDAGQVRAPLVDLSPSEVNELGGLIEIAQAL